MKWNNKFILQTDMVEINAKQYQDKKESDQLGQSPQSPGSESHTGLWRKLWGQVRQRFTSPARSTVFYVWSGKTNKSSARLSRQMR